MDLSKVTYIFNRLKARGQKEFVPAPEAVFQKPIYFFAFGLGSGAIPFAPGTWGTLLAIPFYLLVRPLPLIAYIIFLLCFIAFSAWISNIVSKEIGIHDHPGMNIDEFAGFFVTMINAPHYWGYIVLGFCLFRIFDIFKPFGIRYIDQHIKGGFGMILDDVIAGVYAAIIIQIVALILGHR